VIILKTKATRVELDKCLVYHKTKIIILSLYQFVRKHDKAMMPNADTQCRIPVC